MPPSYHLEPSYDLTNSDTCTMFPQMISCTLNLDLSKLA